MDGSDRPRRVCAVRRHPNAYIGIRAPDQTLRRESTKRLDFD
jgi:hypothetical protein